MERMTDQKHSIVEFFKEKGFDDESINRMMRRCNRLESTGRGRASESWDYLGSIGIQKRRLLYVVSKCPKILTMGFKSEACYYCPVPCNLGIKAGRSDLSHHQISSHCFTQCGREALPITSFLPDARNI
ncbi:unnamed protein product [Musa acuminata subsp. burmannicoides]